MNAVRDMTYENALENSSHLIALDQTTVHLYDDNVPWMMATDVEASGCYRFNGPCGVNISAIVRGITFKWSVDFERRDANGYPHSMSDRERLREVARKLPAAARRKFAAFLKAAVMPNLEQRTAEIRSGLNKQVDSEDCVRGLIAFAESDAA